VCSLEQLLENPEFRSTPDQAVHIFSVLLEFVLLMREKGYRHSDLKPGNTSLVRSEEDYNHYTLKVIDFGSLNQNDENYE
jgi:serine/threonine protein kinase